MNALITIKAARSVDELHQFFAELCDHRAGLHADGILTLLETVDELQAVAEHSGLIDAIGQDAVQDLMGEAIAAASLVPELDEPDLADDLEIEIALRAADQVRAWEIADPRDRWRHTGEPAPIVRPVVRQREPYAPPAATVHAFRYVLSLNDHDYLARWLAEHPSDAPALYKIWKASRC
jgi:hypothetical protein